jgi:microcystin-dependent protein
LIERDGTVGMNAQLRLVGDPINPLDAAPKQYVDQILPVGIIMLFGGAAAPPGGRWAVCNGAELQTTDYPELSALLGTAYGGSAGRFNLPNLVSKFPYGAVPGATGGSADAPVVAHTHAIDHTHAVGTSATDSPDHSHGDDHAHSGTTTGMDRAATHHHTNPAIEGVAGAAFGASLIWDQTTPPGGHAALNSGETNTDHLHAFNTNSKSAQGYGTNTGGASARHAHAFQTPAHAGASGSTGVAATNANLPPFLGVTYIIRIN